MKTSQKYLDEIKTIFIGKTLLVVFGLLIFGNVYSQKCAVGFDLANNRNFKYAGKSGTHFKFIIKNKSNKIDTYSILVNNSDTDSDKNSFKGRSMKSKGRKVSLPIKLDMDTKRGNSGFANNRNSKSSMQNKNSKSSTHKSLEFKLNPNEQTLIVLKVDVPDGTEIGGVNTTNITLKSTNCKNIAITKQVITETVDGE
jgi:hypothetical protein